MKLKAIEKICKAAKTDILWPTEDGRVFAGDGGAAQGGGCQKRRAGSVSPSSKIENGILGLCGETGEIADVYKKYLYQGHELDRDHMAEELGDVCWYVAEMASGLGLPLEEIMAQNIEKLRKRYPDGFDAERSMHREESKQ